MDKESGQYHRFFASAFMYATKSQVWNMLGDARNLYYEDFSDLAATNEIGTKNLVEQFLPCGKNIDRPKAGHVNPCQH